MHPDDPRWQEIRGRWLSQYERGILTEAEFRTLDSCTLHLQLVTPTPEELTLELGFYNHSDTTVPCSFLLEDSYHQQAAFRHLHVFRVLEDNQSIVSFGASHVPWIKTFPSFSPDRQSLHGGLIAPKTQRTFRIPGTLQGTRLELRFGDAFAVEYRVTPGTTYQFRFYWSELLSNTVSWTAPS
ncbi:hypothetical protein [Armatimonas rosea]|uniref:Uncharacterized protein n=1 Tax=Armatimonas rosea TaxID=685828 RepID=A0A7W9SN90_ARMRO|nr:hypothetical protein [Armatimonas rosea]MBB6049760.1 hypothetical protein [Armatimonas rosea]